MDKFLRGTFILVFIFSSIQLTSAQSSYNPTQLIVMFSDMSSNLKAHFEMNYASVLSEKTKPVLLSYDANCWLFTTRKTVDSLHVIIQKMKEDKNIKALQFNYKAEYRSNIPNDSLFQMQWNLRNLGVNGSLLNADISASNAWDLTGGGVASTNDTLIIAIIDGGFQLDHPDLNFWKNTAEIPNDGIDNDSNSYVDDYLGWNTLAGTGNINNAVHGTQVAGIAAARGNNTIGISGVNWNAKLMAVRGTSNPINDSLIIASYGYVLRQRKIYNETQGLKGAFVVATNSSFGINNAPAALHPVWCEMYDSLGYAGILNATATANQAVNVDLVGDMPSTCTSSYMIAVTNSTSNDQLNSFAAYGKLSVDIAAPGTSIYSTSTFGTYSVSTGTSMASPHVAGAIAFLLSSASPAFISYYKAHPSEATLFLKKCILEHVDTLSSLKDTCLSNGRLNLFKSAAYIHQLPDSVLSIMLRSNQSNTLELVSIFPNPASTYLMTIVHANTNKRLLFTIYDVIGKKKCVIEKNTSSAFETFQLYLTDFPNGIYYLQCSDGKYTSKALKFIINK